MGFGNEVAGLYVKAIMPVLRRSDAWRFAFAAVSLSLWFLTPLCYGPMVPPLSVLLMLAALAPWICVIIPLHLWVIARDERLWPVHLHPILGLRCLVNTVIAMENTFQLRPILRILLVLPALCLGTSLALMLERGV